MTKTHQGALRCFIDFQYYGDFFLLLHSIAFFLGVVWVALYSAVAARLPEAARNAGAVMAILLAVLMARPGPTRPPLQVITKMAAPDTTLADQREVAAEIVARIGSRPVLFMQNGEQLYLMRRQNALPLIYCNRPLWWRYRSSPEESWPATCERLMNSVEAFAVVPPRTVGHRRIT